jgi:hypothetical protein
MESTVVGVQKGLPDEYGVLEVGDSKLQIAGFSAAHELDDFQAVAFFQFGLGPKIAWSDFAVEFYGDAVGLHTEGFDQGAEGEGTS